MFRNVMYVYTVANVQYVSFNFPLKILFIIKVKVRFTLEQARKAHRGSRGIAVLFL